jgi:hypothetical protein
MPSALSAETRSFFLMGIAKRKGHMVGMRPFDCAFPASPNGTRTRVFPPGGAGYPSPEREGIVPDGSTPEFGNYGSPNGTRTRVFGVRGRYPRPLDDGTPKMKKPCRERHGLFFCWLGDEDSNPVPDFFIIELSIYCKPFFLVVYTWCLHLIPPQRRGFHG